MVQALLYQAGWMKDSNHQERVIILTSEPEDPQGHHPGTPAVSP